MRSVILLSILCALSISSRAATIPASQIAFDDFVKHDVAAGVAHEAMADEDYGMEAAFSSFAASSQIRNLAMESPKAKEPESSIKLNLKSTKRRNRVEYLEELVPSREAVISYSMTEEDTPLLDELRATPEEMLMMYKRRTGPMEIPEESPAASMEPETLDGMEEDRGYPWRRT